MEIINRGDLNRLRDLAKEQVELANSHAMADLRDRWERHGNFEPGTSPMILIEIDTFEDDILPPLMECKSSTARELERELLLATVNHKLFGDDTIVKNFMPVKLPAYFIPFDIEVKRVFASDGNNGTGVGHHFIPAINDLEQDFIKLGKSRYGIDRETFDRNMELRQNIYGDILPVRREASVLYCGLTMNIVNIMPMEEMYVSMYEYPELFNEMMSMLTDDYIAFFDFLENEKVLLPTHGACRLYQGSYCYNNELTNQGTGLKTENVWGYTDSQEMTGVSPDMFVQFAAPYYRRIIERYGLLSYGCCEAVDSIWDDFLSGLHNLRKVSVSSWANEEYFGECLQGKKIVYMRKPTPNLLGVGKDLDEQAVLDHINKTVKASKGSHLEIIQRDVYRINNTPDKIKKYVELIRQCCETHIT